MSEARADDDTDINLLRVSQCKESQGNRRGVMMVCVCESVTIPQRLLCACPYSKFIDCCLFHSIE